MKEIFTYSATLSEKHVSQLEQIISRVNLPPYGAVDPMAEALVKEINALSLKVGDHQLVDSAFPVTHQCMNHYKITIYGMVCACMHLLELEDVAFSADTTQQEVKSPDLKLTVRAGTIQPRG